MKFKPIEEFFEQKPEPGSLSEGLTNIGVQPPDLPLLNNEVVFIMNVRSGEMTFKKGFDLLGWKDSSMNLEKYTQLFHPEDAPYVHRLSQQCIHWLINHPEASQDFLFYVSFRIRNRKGDYIKVLCRVSCHDTLRNGSLHHAMVHLSDISFTDASDAVSYRFRARGLDRQDFHHSAYREYLELFTAREIQIVRLIEKNFSNEDISRSLEISKHTVSTHRKNILKKCSAHSAEELVVFCRKNGIL